ncbi:MAG: histidinol-phosphate transaminase [Anaerovoracaceae bacterium]
MSEFLNKRFERLVPYTPGEQPQNREYIKLNTNESPFGPSPGVARAVEQECGRLNLYSDPESRKIREKIASLYDVEMEQVIVANGSDEVLFFAFMAFCGEDMPVVFADITYGFYPVFAEITGVSYEEIPLRNDFSLNPDDYTGIGKTIVIANPNAPSGLPVALSDIEKIVSLNPENVVIVDEAYVDFGAESAVSLTKKYDNLVVMQTFSKSRSMAGARLGFAIGSRKLIGDLNTIKYSINPYNINRMTEAAGCAAIEDNQYYMDNCKTIIENRRWTACELEKLGFHVIPSSANFIFAESDKICGQELYEKLKERGILIRHFTKERIANFNRITIGTMSEMEAFIENVKELLKEAE